jgi:hypothetical protein
MDQLVSRWSISTLSASAWVANSPDAVSSSTEALLV